MTSPSGLHRLGETDPGIRNRTEARAGSGPDFLCIGLQKAGTYWLYDQLEQHPEFWMPPLKELRYFNGFATNTAEFKFLLEHGRRPVRAQNDDPQAEKCFRPLDERDRAFLERATALLSRETDCDAYSRLFDFKDGLLSGDLSPQYSAIDASLIEKIIAKFPELRVVLLVRDPIERFWSALSMKMRNRPTVAPKSADDWDDVLRFASDRGVRALSFPSKIAARWRRFVAPERFAFYFFDDICGQPVATRRSILSFLGADPEKPSGGLSPGFDRKRGQRKQPVSDAIRERLIEHFADELRACARTFGGPALDWPARYGL